MKATKNKSERVADEAVLVDSAADNTPKTVKSVHCPVLYWNKYSENFAFRYKDKVVQLVLPEPIKECGEYVDVKYSNGKYELV